MNEEYLRQILKVRDYIKKPEIILIRPGVFMEFLDALWPMLNNFMAELNEIKKQKIQETQPELPVWKKFPMRLSEFEKSHEFCIKMHFGQGRLAGILGADGATMFEGTYNKVKSNAGNRWHYFIEPETFLVALLTYPFRNPAERALVEQYKKEKGEQHHGSGG